MPEDDEGCSTAASGHPSGSVGVERGVVNPKSRSCRGCLFYSSFMRDSNQNPTCYGFSRNIPHSYRALEEREATHDFKYACLGYGVHKELMPSAKYDPADGHGELPLCVGVEFLADRRPVGQPSRLHKEEAESSTPSPLTPHTSSQGAANAASDGFSGRFLRSAGLVASGVVNNVTKITNSVRNTIDDVFYPEKKKPPK